MRQLSLLMLLSIVFLMSTARADFLPEVENVQLEGNVLSWDEQSGATGYNIIKGYGYFDTVRGALNYTLSVEGTYAVVAFNDAGDFGSDYPATRLDFSPSEVDSSVNYNYQSRVLYVYKTCKDVGPGESCVARCPAVFTTQYGSKRYPAYLSGGACTTSDIVEADAFVSRNSYKCTVPTYSGEIIAQAICPIQ